MKKSLFVLFGILSVCTAVLMSCLKEDQVLLSGSFVEWDAAAYNANSGGRTYPILQRVPRGSEPVNNADPLITTNSDTVRFRVNLVGPHRAEPTTFLVQALSDEPLPANHFAAVDGLHYQTSGSVVVPPNSSFGYAELIFLPTSIVTTQRGFLVLELQGTADIRPIEAVKRIGISFSLVAN